MTVIARCEEAIDGKRCVYAADHKGICCVYVANDDRGWVFDQLWADAEQLRGAVDRAREVVEAWDEWQDDSSYADPFDRLKQAITELRVHHGGR